MNQAKSTIIIVAHQNRAELQRTVNSVLRAVQHAQPRYSFEIVILDTLNIYGGVYDTGTEKLAVVSSLQSVDPSTPFVFIVPTRTLVAQNWFANAVSSISESSKPNIARPEFNVVWNDMDGTQVMRQTQKIEEIYNIQTPQLSAVVGIPGAFFFNRLLAIPSSTPVDDWLNLGLGWLGENYESISNTAVFTRSEPISDTVDYIGVPLFSFDMARKSKVIEPLAQLHSSKDLSAFNAQTRHEMRRITKGLLRRAHMLGTAKRIQGKLVAQQTQTQTSNLPDWLIVEWRALHRIDNRIFPSNHLIAHAGIFDIPAFAARKIAFVYKQLASQLSANNYDYILFAPWLMRGGADKFTIEYANEIARQRPSLSVLVVTTLDRDSEWSSKLASNVGYLNFGSDTETLGQQEKLFLMKLFVRQSRAKVLHIINSELAYDFVSANQSWLRRHDIRVAATSFSQEIDAQGRVLGYSHSHVPEIYEAATVISSDNNTVLDMWRREYGFDSSKLLLHHLPFATEEQRNTDDELKDIHQGKILKVLWASRLSSEKLPELVIEIGRLLKNDNIHIDMYGTAAHNFDSSFLDALPENVSYKGEFDGMNNLPLSDYDAFLYTSRFDGMPNTLLEIGIAGIPIVSSAVGGIPELIAHKETGLLVEDYADAAAYAEGLMHLRANPELAKKLSSNLRRKIEIDYSAEQFDKAISEMLRRLGI